MSELLEKYRDKYTGLRIGRDRIVVVLSPDKFNELDDSLEAVDRIQHESYLRAGYDNLILDYPHGRIVAILDADPTPLPPSSPS